MNIKKSTKKKLYAYVDESGQDTGGIIFIVSILILEKEKDLIIKFLKEIEQKSGKKNAKWNKSHYKYRQIYIEEIANTHYLMKSIFFETFGDNKKYIELTSYATAKAILKRANDDYKVTIFVDGFRKTEIKRFAKGLRDLHIKTRKIRGVKKEENNALIRLVDAICGLVRDAQKDNKWAKDILKRMQDKGVVSEL
jgi:hypothetical protein